METPGGGASGEIFDSVGKSQDGLPTSGDSPTTTAAVLRYAAQPDVVLSQERDLYYAETLLGESASELAETLLGSRRAVILGPELKALASCLYFGLTNFAGKQTLGQEYCDISLVREGGGSAALSRSSSQAYTFLRVAVPYLQERMREGWHGLRSLRDPFGTGGAAAALAAARARARARAALAPPIGIASPSESEETRGVLAMEHEAPAAVETGGGGHSGGEGREGVVASTPSRSRRRRRSPSVGGAFVALRRLLAWARRKRPATSAVLEWVLRLHLAAFYFDGRFANVAMRAAGAKLAYTRELDEPRARYAILGVLLLVQAAAEAASASAQAATRWRAASEEASLRNPGSGGGRTDGGGGGSRSEGADSALPSRVPAVAPERTPADVALFPRSRRRCSLCMSPRESPAATPCGHLFCWECIVGWCQTNPECPLCRQPATPQSIVCLYQYA